ncbi:MAG: nickel insertion protein [Anaerovoracaceae bacterium]|jgi:uncharacterized protein (DUF111 family)
MELYIDAGSGVSTDMLRDALLDLAAHLPDGAAAGRGAAEHAARQTAALGPLPAHRSYTAMRSMLLQADLTPATRDTALAVYAALAAAEAEVHGETLETVHFHEVGRAEAVANIVAAAAALETLNPAGIWVSAVHDGCGTILCSHGELPVPVPAVRALQQQCAYTFVQDDIEMEMVTPGGLAALIGFGAAAVPPERQAALRKRVEQARRDGRCGVGRGTRDTGRDGLRIYGLLT